MKKKISLAAAIFFGFAVGKLCAADLVCLGAAGCPGGVDIVQLANSTPIFTAIAFVDGTTQTTKATGSGGGDPTISSTETATIFLAGDVMVATGSFLSAPGAYWPIFGSTITMTSAWGFCAAASTVGVTTMNLYVTTGTNMGLSSYFVIDASSYSVPSNSFVVPVSTSPHVPSAVTIVYPQQSLALVVPSVPGSGTMPSDCGIAIEYYRWKKQ